MGKKKEVPQLTTQLKEFCNRAISEDLPSKDRILRIWSTNVQYEVPAGIDLTKRFHDLVEKEKKFTIAKSIMAKEYQAFFIRHKGLSTRAFNQLKKKLTVEEEKAKDKMWYSRGTNTPSHYLAFLEENPNWFHDPSKNPKEVTAETVLDYIIDWENGELTEEQEIMFFSYLVKTGQAWTLQGAYGRTATSFIKNGTIDKQGNIL